MSRRVFITVADASGDQHAAELIRALHQLDPTLQIDALGGPKMAAAGAHLLEETTGQAAMGWRGALRALEASRWLKLVADRYREVKPDLHICIDSSAINLPFAKQAKTKFGIPVLYYIPPQLWASREGRMKKVRAFVDRIASIFPFEASYYQSHGVNATFVGHPLFDELPADRTLPQVRDFGDSPVIGIIPGSRRSEVKANLPHLIEVMNAITKAFPEASFLTPTTSASHELVKQMLAGRADVSIQQDGFDDLIPRCDLVLTKSGTSTVHVAAWRVPMIVVYRASAILWHLLGRWLLKTKKIAMVNILAGQIDLVPEFIPWYGPNQPVIDCALDLLRHPEKLRQQRDKLDALMKTIDQPGASINTAKLAIALMQP